MDNIIIPWEGWEMAKDKPIGRGGFGEVYEIKRLNFEYEEHSAMKLLHVPKDENDIDYLRLEGRDDESIALTYHGYVKDMIREYQHMQSLRNNPNVVHVYDYKVNRDASGLQWKVYIRMELLTPIVKYPACIQTESQILQLGKDICSALVSCHRHNILHRDIKPENIFIDAEGTFKIGDFGIARVVEHTTHASVGVGTPDYMSPEVLTGHSYGVQADIYSLGMVLYWALNQKRHPFLPLHPQDITHEMKEEARRRKWRGEPVPPPVNGSNEFRAIIMKACAFDPKNRFLTAQNMLEALNQIELPATVVDRKEDKEENKTEIEPPLEIPAPQVDDDPTELACHRNTGRIESDEPILPVGTGSVMLDEMTDNGNHSQSDMTGTAATTSIGGYESEENPDYIGQETSRKKMNELVEDKDDPVIPEALLPPLEEENGDGPGPQSIPKAIVVGLASIVVFFLVCVLIILANIISGGDDGYVPETTAAVETIEVVGYQPEEAIGAQRVFVAEWSTGSYKIEIYDESHLGIEFTEEFFNDLQNSENVTDGPQLLLYLDQAKKEYYQVYFLQNAGELSEVAIYYTNDNDNTPVFFAWEEENGVIKIDMTANADVTKNLFCIKEIQVNNITSAGEPDALYTYDAAKNAARVQFLRIAGPDEDNGGITTEKVIIVGLDENGKQMWTHLSDVKYELYQYARLKTVGYVNDKYYYSDDGSLIILNAATGKVVKEIANTGATITDCYVGADGTLYLCNHLGPYFVELSSDGKFEHAIEDFGEYAWAHDIYKEGDCVYVACQLGPNYCGKDFIFEISLKDYSYTLTSSDDPAE